MSKFVEVSEQPGNPFGEEIDEAFLTDEIRDRFYVPGYSDLRRQYDIDVAAGRRPEVLPFRLQWVRRERAGNADSTQISDWKTRGYRLVGWLDQEPLGINLADTPAQHGPNDEVVNGDSVLMVADSKIAAANFKEWQMRDRRQWQERVQEPLEASAERYNAKHGHTSASGTAFDFLVEPQGRAAQAAQPPAEQPAKRPRGRPRKYPRSE